MQTATHGHCGDGHDRIDGIHRKPTHDNALFLFCAPPEPGLHPELTAALRAAVAEKTAAARVLLLEAVTEFGEALTFANSLGAEDVVLTDMLQSVNPPADIFLLDTGRLPTETYALLAELEARYRRRFTLFFPERDAVEAWVRAHGINAFYESVDLRRACCRVHKLEPLKRALAGKRAWITGLRAAQSPTRNGLARREADSVHGLVKLSPLADWPEAEVWAYIRIHGLPYNALHGSVLPQYRLRPLYPRDQPWRRPPRRSLVVGDAGGQGMRIALSHPDLKVGDSPIRFMGEPLAPQTLVSLTPP